MQAEKLAAYQLKKAQLKLQANPPSTSASASHQPLPSILKSPRPPEKQQRDSASGEIEEIASLYPPLAACLAPLAHLQAFFPPELAPSFAELFTSHHLVTVGDVATNVPSSFVQHVPIALRLHVAQSSHLGRVSTVPQLLLEALTKFESKLQADQALSAKKRKNQVGRRRKASGASRRATQRRLRVNARSCSDRRSHFRRRNSRKHGSNE